MRALPPLTLLGLILIGSGLVACDAAPGETDRAFSSSGKIIAMSGGAGGAANACFTCHGLQGQGDGVSAPRLAGLDAGYLQKQMEDYASGLRPDDVMSRIAKGLDPDSRRAVALFYAGLPSLMSTSASPSAATPPPVWRRGDALAASRPAHPVMAPMDRARVKASRSWPASLSPIRWSRSTAGSQASAATTLAASWPPPFNG